jgi:2-furoyl-CoA dehydrogenase large subunit
LHYDYQAQVGGKVAAVGPRMLEGAARLVLGELFAAIGRRHNGVSRSPPAARAGGRVKVRMAQRSTAGERLQRL